MVRSTKGAALMGAIAALVICPSARAALTPADFVVVGNQAYGMLTPDLVAAPYAVDWWWSSSERYVAVVCRAPVGTVGDAQDLMQASLDTPKENGNPEALVIWSSRTDKSRVVWSARDSNEEVEGVFWMPGTDVAFVTTGPSDSYESELRKTHPSAYACRLLRVTAAVGKVSLVAEYPADAPPALEVSPTQPLAFVGRSDPVNPRTGVELQVLRSSGQLGATIHEPEGLGGLDIEWSTDGSTPYALCTKPHPYNATNISQHWFSIDLSSGALTPLAGKPAVYNWASSGPDLDVTREVRALQVAGPETKLPILWLEGYANHTSTRALIAADTDKGEVSGHKDMVIYRSQGAAWVRRIVKVPKQDFQAYQLATARQEVLSAGKQVDLALLMYGDDYDGVLPSPGANVKELLNSYVKDKTLLDGFVYTFAGGLQKDIANPAGTEMGYIPGPGGRAVMYADGHVKWKAD